MSQVTLGPRYTSEDYENLGPGLHKVGPEPYDYVYNAAKGQRASFVNVDGEMYTGTITDVVEDDETGELTLTVRQFPDAPQWLGVSGESEEKP